MSRVGASPRRALDEPTENPGARWVVSLCLANLGVLAGFFGPIQVLLAQQAALITPGEKESTLALVTGLGALSSTVFNPVWGALSDRTLSRFGRRVPWVVMGALGSVLSMWLLSRATTVVMMCIGWVLAQAAINAIFAVIVAAVPDQVPVPQRGTVGGLAAIAQTVGVITGSGVAAVTGSVQAGYLTIAGLLVLTALPYVLHSRDVRLTREELEAVRARRHAPDRAPRDRQVRRDYRWAFATRFLMQFGNALVILYMLYYLQDALDLPARPAEAGVAMLTLVYGVTTVLTAIGGGVVSDRTGRRRPFVIGSGLVVAGALALLASVSTMTGAVVGAAVMGLGFGMYQAVDFALITQVLPEAAGRGRDMGILNIAAALPQVAAPLFAVLMITVFGVSYPLLYLTAAGVSALGSLLVLKIKSVR